MKSLRISCQLFLYHTRDTIREIGYTNAEYGFDAETCGVLTAIDEQSADIAMGVDRALEAKEHNLSDEEIEAIGAGDSSHIQTSFPDCPNEDTDELRETR